MINSIQGNIIDPVAPLINYSALGSQHIVAARSVGGKKMANLNNGAAQALLTLCLELCKSIPTWLTNFHHNDSAMRFQQAAGSF